MKCLAFTMISNDPKQFGQFLLSLPYAMIPDWQHSLYLVIQYPFDLKKLAEFDEIIWRINKTNNLTMIVDIIPPIIRKGNVLDFLGARRHFLKRIENDHNDYIYWCDDDFRFNSGERSYLHASSADRIYDSCCYLDDNPSCGLVQHMTFFGGSQAGLKIKPVRGGFFETGIGFTMRGHEAPYIDKRFNFFGAGSDVAVYITKIMNGYHIARNYNNPTRKRPTNQVVPGNPNTHYDLNYITTKGFIHQLREMTGGYYKYGKEPPKEIKALHRIGASLKGLNPFY